MIDYGLLDNASKYYTTVGFSRIESPWMVTESIDRITKPHGVKSNTVTTKNKTLVASGEQSFLYLYVKNYLPLGKFQTITPCFRDDPYDFTHRKEFMKLELIDTIDVNSHSLDNMIDKSFKFFENYYGDFSHLLSVVKTNDGFDIEIDGIEVGSYGIRECDFLKYIYGTGVAEPRASRMKNKLKGL